MRRHNLKHLVATIERPVENQRKTEQILTTIRPILNYQNLSEVRSTVLEPVKNH